MRVDVGVYYFEGGGGGAYGDWEGVVNHIIFSGKFLCKTGTEEGICLHMFYNPIFMRTTAGMRLLMDFSVDPLVKTPRTVLEAIKWQTKFFVPFHVTHAQTKHLRAFKTR